MHDHVVVVERPDDRRGAAGTPGPRGDGHAQHGENLLSQVKLFKNFYISWE